MDCYSTGRIFYLEAKDFTPRSWPFSYDLFMTSVFLERLGIALIIAGSLYVGLGLFGVVPLELEGVSVSNIRIPSGIAIIGCLIAAFSTRNR